MSVASVGWYPTAEGMRPKSADTSEPACVKRKMLSTKRSTSSPSSRKYSATVRPESATRRRAPRRLGHLSVDERDLRLADGVHIHLRHVELARLLEVLVELLAVLDDLRLDHLAQEVVALARALADAREDREARVLHGDVVDQLHDEHGLADARAAEEADLTAAQEGLDEIDDLDAGLEHLHPGGLLVERGGVAVDGVALLGVDRPEVVHGLADDVEHTPQGRLAHGDGDVAAGVGGDHAAHDALGRL